MNNLPKLLVRADAGPDIGSGHLMRGMALAVAWRSLGGQASFISRCRPELKKRLSDRSFSVSEPVADGLGDVPKDAWLVLDGYQFDSPFLERANTLARTVVLDDHGHRPRLAGTFVVNPNAGAEEASYDVSGAMLLVGPRFALLRPEFAEPPRRSRRSRPRVLVAMGGADSANLTEAVVAELSDIQADVVAVAGPDNPHIASLKKACGNSGATLRTDIEDMRSLMLDCDAAVAAGGVTALECAAAGLPAVLFALAENQRAQVDALSRAGAAIGLPADGRRRVAQAVRQALDSRTMGEAGRSLVDGRGAERVASILAAASTEELLAKALRIRPTRPSDLLEIWRLANAVRSFAFVQDSIPLARHREWFGQQLSSRDVRYWVVEVADSVVGQIRFSRVRPEVAEVHLSFYDAFRGKGLGTRALKDTTTVACEELGVRRVMAQVIQPNEPSCRAFVKAGYAPAGRASERGRDCSLFQFTCS